MFDHNFFEKNDSICRSWNLITSLQFNPLVDLCVIDLCVMSLSKMTGRWSRLWEHSLRLWSNADTRRRFHMSSSRGVRHFFV